VYWAICATDRPSAGWRLAAQKVPAVCWPADSAGATGSETSALVADGLRVRCGGRRSPSICARWITRGSTPIAAPDVPICAPAGSAEGVVLARRSGRCLGAS
jgi:hypothetical protein